MVMTAAGGLIISEFKLFSILLLLALLIQQNPHQALALGVNDSKHYD